MRVSVKLVAVLVWLTTYAVVGGPPAHGDAPTGTCARAAALVDDGNLRDARALAVVVGPACEGEVLPLTVQAARSAQALAERAAAAPSDTGKKRLAKLALTIDDANTDAQAVLDSLDPEQDADACTAVEDAIDGGELARAQALLDALADDDSADDCRTAATLALAEAQEVRWPTRIQRFVVDDGLTTWLVALIAFAIGVIAAGFVRFSSPFRPAAVFTGVVALLLVGWQLLDWPSVLLAVLLVLLLALSVAAGLWLSNAVRTRSPVRVSVSGDDTDAVEPEVIAELHALGESRASGVYAPANTDVSDSGVSAALDQISNPVVKALAAIWRAVQLGAGDRVEVVVVSPKEAPCSATVTLYVGRRLVSTAVVDGATFCADPAKPTKAEVASSARDVATGVAAAILLGRLDLGSPSRAVSARERLYGATDPLGVALAAVAARRLSQGDAAASSALYARAVDRDPANKSARFGRISAVLRTYPTGRTAQRLIDQLGELRRDESTTSPLGWRIDYTRAAGIVNAALADRTANRALLQDVDVVAAFQKARLLLRDLPEKPAVASDAKLLAQLRQLADVTDLGLRAPTAPNVADLSEQLLRKPLTVPSVVLHNIACGLAFAYARTSRKHGDRRRRLAEACVDRLRLAGDVPARRTALLTDPCIAFVATTKPFLGLKKDWGVVKDDPYADVDSIGDLSATLTESYARPSDLAVALASPSARATTATTYGVDSATVQRWRGAATWLAAGRPVERINLYQASGYPDPPSAAVADDSVLLGRLRATAKVTGTDELPSVAERAAMAQP
ncbi:hypothetical protein [Nocardioides sp.]|uniref:hypothetical protein n=1 Tax=Nocardioides sp. TaxID=35761 RepID=UPI0037840CA3